MPIVALLACSCGRTRVDERHHRFEDRAPITVAQDDHLGQGGGPRAEPHDEPADAPASVGPALAALAEARCSHDIACGRVGKGREYLDRDTCVRTTLQQHGEDVAALTCAMGVDAVRLAQCEEMLRDQSCDDDPAAAACGALCRGQ